MEKKKEKRFNITHKHKIAVLKAIRLFYSRYHIYGLDPRQREVEENTSKQLDTINSDDLTDEMKKEICHIKRKETVNSIHRIIKKQHPFLGLDADSINAILGEFFTLKYVESTEFCSFCYKLTASGYEYISQCEKEIYEKSIGLLEKILIPILSLIAGGAIAIITAVIVGGGC